jgi:hypothetical protein
MKVKYYCCLQGFIAARGRQVATPGALLREPTRGNNWPQGLLAAAPPQKGLEICLEPMGWTQKGLCKVSFSSVHTPRQRIWSVTAVDDHVDNVLWCTEGRISRSEDPAWRSSFKSSCSTSLLCSLVSKALWASVAQLGTKITPTCQCCPED